MFEDTRVVIRSRKSNDRQYNGHRQKDKQQSTKLYTEDRVIRTQLKQGVNSVTQLNYNSNKAIISMILCHIVGKTNRCR
jgi:hypothetical protein